MTFSEKIVLLRKQCNMSQEDLADKIGVKRQTIFKYEKGIIGDITLNRLDSLAQALNVSASYLAGWVDNNENNQSINKATSQFKCIKFSEEELKNIEDYILYIISKRNTQK